jgi:hypothetical protein
MIKDLLSYKFGNDSNKAPIHSTLRAPRSMS